MGRLQEGSSLGFQEGFGLNLEHEEARAVT